MLFDINNDLSLDIKLSSRSSRIVSDMKNKVINRPNKTRNDIKTYG